MTNEARRHHYIPICYLKNFTDSGRRDGQFYVFDWPQRRQYRTSPKNVAAEKDFNRVTIPGVEPDAIETSFSKLESQFDAALTALIARPVWDDELKNMIFNLMALLAVRSPQAREARRRPMEQVAKMMMQFSTSSPEHFAGLVERAGAAGETLPQVSYEDAKRFVDEGRYKIEVPNERHIVDESKLVDTLLELFAMRRWGALISPPGAGDFVTSDNPIALTWNHPEQVPPMYRHSPGFGMRNSTVHFAISPRLALYGTFEPGEDFSLEVSPRLVAIFNRHIIERTYKRTFTPGPTIRLLDLQDQVEDFTAAKLLSEAPADMGLPDG